MTWGDVSRSTANILRSNYLHQHCLKYSAVDGGQNCLSLNIINVSHLTWKKLWHLAPRKQFVGTAAQIYVKIHKIGTVPEKSGRMGSLTAGQVLRARHENSPKMERRGGRSTLYPKNISSLTCTKGIRYQPYTIPHLRYQYHCHYHYHCCLYHSLVTCTNTRNVGDLKWVYVCETWITFSNSIVRMRSHTPAPRARTHTHTYIQTNANTWHADSITTGRVSPTVRIFSKLIVTLSSHTPCNH
jgi:hypothetical protein